MTQTDELEPALRMLFDRQARAIEVPALEPDDLVTGGMSRGQPSPGALRVAIIAVAALVPLFAVGLFALRSDDSTVRAGNEPNTPETPTVTAVASRATFVADTRRVAMSASAVTIEAGGVVFTPVEPVTIHSDPGTWNEYTTLELEWPQHGVDMRLYIYFSSDGTDWWSNEIRTYDGSREGEWITYTGEFFRSALGAPFSGNLNVAASDHGVDAKLQITDLVLEAFRRPDACQTKASPFALEPDIDALEVTGVPQGYGLGVTLLDTSTCTVSASASDVRYMWRAGASDVVAVTANGAHAQLNVKQPYETLLTVVAVDTSGRELATTEIRVIGHE